MSRNRHDRVTNHFGEDLDTNSLLDGDVVDIEAGSTVHEALYLIRTGGDILGDDPINYADPDYGTHVYYPDFVGTEILAGETVLVGHTGGVSNPANPQYANDTTATHGASHFSQTRSERVSFAGSGAKSYWWGVDFGTARFVSQMRVWNTGQWLGQGSIWTNTVEYSDDNSTWTPMGYTYSSVTVPTGNTWPYATSTNERRYLLDSTESHRYWRLRKSGSFGLQFFTGDAMTSWYIDGLADADWVLGPLIQDGSDTTYQEATYGDACLRVDLGQQRLVYQAIVHLSFASAEERTYGFYGTNESDYSDLVLLDEATFTPTGIYDGGDNIPFTWPVASAYQYYVLIGPEETRRLHELTLHAATGAVTTSHPLTTNRDLPEQHPASAISFDDTVAGTGQDNAQDALEIMTSSTAGPTGLSAIINNVTPGVKFDIEMPFAGSITAARLFADASGSIVVDLWKDSYPNYAPTVADSICASAKPTLSSALKSQDITLTGWTTGFEVGDVIRVNVDSSTTLTRATLALRLDRSASSPVVGSIQLGRIDRTATAHAPTVT